MTIFKPEQIQDFQPLPRQDYPGWKKELTENDWEEVRMNNG